MDEVQKLKDLQRLVGALIDKEEGRQVAGSFDPNDINDLKKIVKRLAIEDEAKDDDRNRVYRFGTVCVRWSPMSERWIIQDGVAIIDSTIGAKEAVQMAKKISGYREENTKYIIHVEPLQIDLEGVPISADAASSFSPSQISLPPMDIGGGGMGGGGGVSLNIPDTGGGGSMNFDAGDIGGSMSAEMPPTPGPAEGGTGGSGLDVATLGLT